MSDIEDGVLIIDSDRRQLVPRMTWPALKAAAKRGAPIIFIDDGEIQKEVTWLIRATRYSHSVSFCCGLSAICVAGFSSSSSTQMCYNLTAVSVGTAVFFRVLRWLNPCHHYDYQRRVRFWRRDQNDEYKEESGVCLVRKNHDTWHSMHRGVAVVALGICCWRLYKSGT